LSGGGAATGFAMPGLGSAGGVAAAGELEVAAPLPSDCEPFASGFVSPVTFITSSPNFVGESGVEVGPSSFALPFSPGAVSLRPSAWLGARASIAPGIVGTGDAVRRPPTTARTFTDRPGVQPWRLVDAGMADSRIATAAPSIEAARYIFFCRHCTASRSSDPVMPAA
jgi:hypothetical protein